MAKRKHSLVDLTLSPPLPLTSRAVLSREDSPTRSSRAQSNNLSSPKHLVHTPQPVNPGPSRQAIDIDATSNEIPAEPSAPVAGPSNPYPARHTASPPSSHLLGAHTCPICFSGVTNACLTPCGHVLCGACLFAAVKSGIQRTLSMGMVAGGEATAAKCPVCRAVLKGWDGRGGGVIPLKIRTIVAL